MATMFLLGDSTVTDQRYEPGASWGEMLPAFLRPDIAIANNAESGETLKSFLTGLRLDKVLGQVRPGDFALIQFGHNDQKEASPQSYAEAATTYRAICAPTSPSSGGAGRRRSWSPRPTGVPGRRTTASDRRWPIMSRR